ncbi:uncharacterized protein BJ212DRAFT_1295924 [Suillus subaureus]|uniref:Uncharacterized protein n=1 Tax=Suillus subaureus TaxID=48587 RepID=A0A9P7JIY6_9AGAM|nr:uncharacterized protein BJ212DRAFT_1295924 [Suillus subaureus]KAG1824862.1 hypothetical protein BJ212DRAFT_1295924 [Suillus subaureus]
MEGTSDAKPDDQLGEEYFSNRNSPMASLEVVNCIAALRKGDEAGTNQRYSHILLAMQMWSWNTQPNSHAQRKFIELIFDRTGKYANWDPPSEIQVGSYGRIDKATGNLSSKATSTQINSGILSSVQHHAKDCPDETEFTTWSKNVKRIEMNVDSYAGVPGIAAASIKGTWQVKKGTTGAVLLMNNPRMKHITSDVLGKLASIKFLQTMHLVTKVFYCPAFSCAGGEKISMALVASAPVVAPVGTLETKASMRWWSDTQTGLARHGCKTEHCFTPLYELLHVRHPRNRRSSPSPERTGEQLWVPAPVPWAPLLEDGYRGANIHQLKNSLHRRIQIPVTLRKNEVVKSIPETTRLSHGLHIVDSFNTTQIWTANKSDQRFTVPVESAYALSIQPDTTLPAARVQSNRPRPPIML